MLMNIRRILQIISQILKFYGFQNFKMSITYNVSSYILIIYKYQIWRNSAEKPLTDIDDIGWCKVQPKIVCLLGLLIF